MLSTLLPLSLLTLLCGALPTPLFNAGVALNKRAGPSGTVISPYGGQEYGFFSGIVGFSNLTDQYGLTGTPIYVQYQGVSQSGAYGNFTISLDLFLEDPTGTNADIPIATRLAPPAQSSTIETYFIPPSTACANTWNLVFIEHQAYDGPNLIEFRSAAPFIGISCEPFAA